MVKVSASRTTTEKRMDLLLWRHAEAADGEPDHERALTAHGIEQAHRIATWLGEHGPKYPRVLASPTRRTRQTASALGADFAVLPALGPAASATDLLAATGWPNAGGAVLIVGHQPSLGRLAALLLSGKEAPWTVKKGALWWFSHRMRGNQAQTILRAVIGAELS